MIDTPYLLIAAMDVEPEHEDVFNELYDVEHVPALCSVPGVRSAVRFRAVPFRLAVGGTEAQIAPPASRYVAVYELDDPGVVRSASWSAAVESGRWRREVRPFTRDRNHMMLERLIRPIR
jgi:hypothetical protein